FAIATGARVRPAPETCLAPDLFPQRHPGEGRDPVHRAAKAEVDVWRDRVHALRSEASRADRMRRARRDVHGSRPVPSGALSGALGAGMTLECAASVPLACGAIVLLACGAIVPTNVIPAQAGTQYTAQRGAGRRIAHAPPAGGACHPTSTAMRCIGLAP